MKTFETEKNNIPEGATHKFDSEGGSGFYRLNGDKWYFWSFGRECWKCVVDNSPLYKPVAIDKPEVVEWNGEGLPPVGVECEWIGGGLNHGDWGLVIVHAYHNDSAWIEKLRDNSMHTVGNPAHFRKPESPEEKDKREAVQRAMDFLAEDDHGGEAYYYKGWFDALYDEGMLTNYRKGE